MKLSFVFTSDEHGYLAGAPHIQKVAAEARRENPGRTMLVSSGDVFQGGPESDLDGGKPGVDILHAAGYDVVEVGNHDFDNGPEFFRKWVADAPYSVLAGNLKDRAGQQIPGTRPWIVREMDGVKVGLLGVVTPDTPSLGYAKNFQDFQFEDPIQAAKRSIEELRAQGCDVIGVLSHLGSSGDRALAAQIDVDFILGGHTHEMREKPEMIRGIPVCQPGSFRNAVGRLDLELDPATRRPIKFEHRLVRIAAEEPADDEVGKLVRSSLQKLEEVEGKPVVHLACQLNWSPTVPDRLDDILGKGMQRLAGTKISLHNGKLPRKSLQPGDLTGKDLRAVLPFPNEVVRITLDKAELIRIVEEAQNRLDETTLFLGGALPLAESDKATGKVKVTDVTYEDGTPVESTVVVATTDFLAQGALGYFRPTEVPTGFGFVRDALRAELAAAPPS